MITEVSSALLVIDHVRLQRAAWAEFHTARKQLDRAARDLHRHEEVDVPAFSAWLHLQYPIQVTALRELRDEVNAKSRQIRMVQIIAATTGRSLKQVWRDQKTRATRPKVSRSKTRATREPEFDDGEEEAERRKDVRQEDFAAAPPPPRSSATRDIYRRLVQRLHPDRGGTWTPGRERLWHEVQKAWANGDGDWLARLEVEWESAHEVIGPTSPLSRLRAAIEEVSAAWRDTQAKLQEYRSLPQWRFTRTAASRRSLERRVEADFARETKSLERQLRYFDQTIGAWEEDWTRADSRPIRRNRRPFQFNRRPR